MLPQPFLDKLETLPAQPGCYLFKDKKGEVVYVGKAKSLRSRVRSYFQQSSGDERYFIPLLQRTVGDFETVVTATEKEAAILEDSLIKEHRPRYNVKLRDDKSYLCLRIDVTHAWPRLEPVRRPSRRRRALLRPLPLGDGRAPHAAPRQQALSAPHLLGPRVRQPQAAVPPVPDQALPRALRLRGRPAVVQGPGPRGGAVPRRAPRRALERARTSA